MKTTFASIQRPSGRGFTLVELLVVIVIIAILASLAVPVTNAVMVRANEVRTKAVMKDIQVAIGHYRTEYNRFPVDLSGSASGGDDIDPIITDDTNTLISVLMAMVDPNSGGTNMNSRGIKFIDLAIAKNGQSFGIIDTSGGTGGGNVRLVDIWGQPYRIYLDTNLDNRIENPDTQNIDQRVSSRAPQYLPSSSAVQCLGADKTINTKDDIVSWR